MNRNRNFLSNVRRKKTQEKMWFLTGITIQKVQDFIKLDFFTRTLLSAGSCPSCRNLQLQTAFPSLLYLGYESVSAWLFWVLIVDTPIRTRTKDVIV